LRDSPIQAGSQVALAFTNSLDFIVWLFALFELDTIACPIDPHLSTPETQRLLDAGHIDYFCDTRAGKWEDWFRLATPEQAAGTLWCRNTDFSSQSVITEHDIVLRQFTSGSTGTSRHILRSGRQLAADYSHFCGHLGLDANEQFLGVAPFYHAYGALGLFAGLSVGASVLPVPRFIPGELLGAARLFHPSVFLATPPMIELLGRCLLRDGESGAFDALRYCICSTGKLKQHAGDSFTKRFRVPVSVLYGSSETLSATIDQGPDFVENRVGRPFPGVAINIFDGTDNATEVGVIGRIGISSPASCTAYVDSGQLLYSIDNFVLPGDRGYLDREGQLYVLGRDDCIDIGGYKVDPIEVQLAIQQELPVNDVVELPYERAGQAALRAIVEANPDTVTVERVAAVCKRKLAAYKIPARIDIYAELPRDGNGKILSANLSALLAAQADA
jgi:long-chain acyl-CoA synthetase